MVHLQDADGGTAFNMGVAVNIDFIGTRRKKFCGGRSMPQSVNVF